MTSVRSARASDLSRLSAIESAAEQRFARHGVVLPDQALTPDREWQAAQAEDRLLVAVDDADAPVGFAFLEVVDGEAYIDEIDVHPAFQGRGFGTALLDAVADWARARGFPAVLLTTFSEVPWNGPFYRKRGYVDLGPGEIGPELAAIRRSEVERGIEVVPRCAMRRPG